MQDLKMIMKYFVEPIPTYQTLSPPLGKNVVVGIRIAWQWQTAQINRRNKLVIMLMKEYCNKKINKMLH